MDCMQEESVNTATNSAVCTELINIVTRIALHTACP